MGILYSKHIIKSRKSKTANIFESLFDIVDFENVLYSSPQDYIRQYWNKYLSTGKHSNTVNGNFFELVIHTLLYREGLLPFYAQAKVAFVPNVKFDTILYTPARPISLSLKTSLRERYKQADLEAIALQHVHRRAESYLLTLDPNEAELCKAKIKSGDIIGLNKIIDCNTSDIDNLIDELHLIKTELTEAQSIKVVTGNLIK